MTSQRTFQVGSIELIGMIHWLDNCTDEVEIARPIDGLALIAPNLKITNFSIDLLFDLALLLHTEETIHLV